MRSDPMKKPFAKQLILSTMALTLVGGGGYLLKGQNAFAATTATTTDTAQSTVKNQDYHVLGMVRRVNDELIAFLKLEKSAYQEKIASGKTLAEIATEQGISRDVLKVELTKEVTANLEKEKADFALNLDNTVDAVQPAGKGDGDEGFGQDGGHRGGKQGGARIDLTTVATALGYATADELKTALIDGTSIADLAAAKGVTLQNLVDLQVIEITKNLDANLASGKLTQAEYDKQKAEVTTTATNIINDKHDGKGGPGGRGGKNHPGGNNQKTTTPTATPSATPAITSGT
jgi:hypothetical protein